MKTMKTQRGICLFLMVGALCLAACAAAPIITESEKKELDETASPIINDVIYEQALAAVGRYINTETGFSRTIQPKTIGNSTGGMEIPMDITNMVITALGRAAGKNLIIAPWDPEYVTNDKATGGASSRMLPILLIGGSITEFDKDVDTKEKSAKVNLIVDRGDAGSNPSLNFSRSEKFSRVAIDLELIDYYTHTVIPGCSVSNTVTVMELEKDAGFSFSIYGSGVDLSGNIQHQQGLQHAVRNLVDFSVLQLLGRYYNFPYWRALDVESADPDVLAALKKSFMQRDERRQNIIIQNLLNEYKLGDQVVNSATGAAFSGKLIPTGALTEKDLVYIEAFKAKYQVKVENGDALGLYVALIEHLPIGAAKASEPRTGAPAVGGGQSLPISNRFQKTDREPAIRGY